VVGEVNTLIIDLNYNVWGFGNNRFGNLGLGDTSTLYLKPTQLIGFKCLQISSGYRNTMIIGTLLL